MKIIDSKDTVYNGIYEVHTLACPQILAGSKERAVSASKTFIVTFDDNTLQDFYNKVCIEGVSAEDVVVTGMSKLSKNHDTEWANK